MWHAWCSELSDLLSCWLDLYLVTWHNVNEEVKHVILGDSQSNVRPLQWKERR